MKAMDGVAIGKRLRELRGDRTQREIAEGIGVTTMAISQYEQGERIPNDKMKMRLAKFFGQSIEKLFYAS